jgi:ribosomal protein S18 acetylase RimI-like enzyme
MTPTIFQVERLDPTRHRRDLFTCESEPLTKYLRERARKETDSKASICYVLVPRDETTRIAGYYTVSSSAVALAKLAPEVAKCLPRYPELPVTLLGRLARDSSFKGSGVGALLIKSVFKRVCANSAEIGSIGLVTDPINDHARAFYEKYDFIPLDDRRMILFMAEVCAWGDL